MQSGVSLGAVSVAVDASGSCGAVCALDSSVNVWAMGDYASVGGGIKQVRGIKLGGQGCWLVGFADGLRGRPIDGFCRVNTAQAAQLKTNLNPKSINT